MYRIGVPLVCGWCMQLNQITYSKIVHAVRVSQIKYLVPVGVLGAWSNYWLNGVRRAISSSYIMSASGHGLGATGV